MPSISQVAVKPQSSTLGSSIIDWVNVEKVPSVIASKVQEPQEDESTSQSTSEEEAKIPDPWKAVIEKASGKSYWWNTITGETTDLDAPKPAPNDSLSDKDTWTAVIDKATGLTYWWNKGTGETTDVGAPRPEEEPLTIKFDVIIGWKELFDMFSKTHLTKRSSHFVAEFPGVTAQSIPCPKSCQNLTYSFQPDIFRLHGGVCGVDLFSTVYHNEKTRLFIIPSLKMADESIRGVIATTSGVVFDLNGGCDGCITTEPEIGDTLEVKRISQVAPTLVCGMHSHSSTYFHTILEQVPRLTVIMDYVRGKFSLDPKSTLVVTRSPLPLLNSINSILDWGLTPTFRKASGSFFKHDAGFVEATDRIIVPMPRNSEWIDMLVAARSCMLQNLMKFDFGPESLKCADVDLPEKYILFIPREGERGRTLLNSSALMDFFEQAFNVPVYVPNLKYGCNLADNMRFFRDAIGFISTHGAAFTNINFIANHAMIIQITPPKPNPFLSPTISLTNMGKALGHHAYTLECPSTKEPRWDMHWNNDVFLRWACNKPREFSLPDKSLPDPKTFQYVFSPLRIWEPKYELKLMCVEYLKRLKDLKAAQSSVTDI